MVMREIVSPFCFGRRSVRRGRHGLKAGEQGLAARGCRGRLVVAITGPLDVGESGNASGAYPPWLEVGVITHSKHAGGDGQGRGHVYSFAE
jgi:hypothetical protein